MAGPVEKLEAEVRKLTALMKKLAADSSDMRGEVATKDELNDLRSDLVDQLGIDKAIEARVARLEATVYGDKH